MTFKKSVLYAVAAASLAIAGLASAGLAVVVLTSAVGSGTGREDIGDRGSGAAIRPAGGAVPTLRPPFETDDSCCRRAFLVTGGAVSWGTLTRFNGGWLTAAHVLEGGGEITDGPGVGEAVRWPVADVAFLGGAAPDPAILAAAPELTGRVTLRGYPSRSATLQTVKGFYYTSAIRSPGEWIRLEPGEEPLVPGFSGGGVYNADGELVAIIQGESIMRATDGTLQHMARVIPLRALAEAQTAVVSIE